MKSYPKARKSNIVVSDLLDETLVYDLNNNKVYCLNETCRKVWERCDGTRSLDQIGLEIDRKAAPEFRREFVRMALTQLERSDLLEGGFSAESTSRREMMRILGTAGAMALPLITAITAPKAAQAQSGGASCSPGIVCAGASGGCCLTSGASCCGGTTCCPSSTFCCGTTCCGATTTCCGTTCCVSGQNCCNNSCCSGSCCPSGLCCGRGTSCCGSTCCGSTSTCCNNTHCCPSNLTCCGSTCCNPALSDCVAGVCVPR